MNYESYDEYIQSKTYLIDEIPSHWEIVPMNQFVNLVTDYVANGSFASLRANVEYKNEEDYAILVRLADNTNNFSGPFVYIDEDAYNFLSKSKLYEGDIVLSNTGSIGSIFKVPNLGKPMSLGPNSLLIRFDNQILANYFFYLFNCDIGMKFLESITTVTTQPKFNKTDFRKLPMIMPPFTEQKQIANYLDKKTAKIDATIAKNEELIELLEEKRVALINQVVTKGLNPDVPMKDSGVKWIGEIPKHWSIRPLKSVANIIMGQSPDSKDINDEKQGILFMQGNADFTNLYPQPSEYCTSPKKISREEDILMSVRAPVGELNISDKRYGIGRGLCSIKPIKVTQSFLWYYLLKSKTDFNYYSNGSTFDAITIGNLSSFPITIPELNEQKEIGVYLNKETSNIDKIIEKVTSNIQLLEEYKTSLIHHVVTGKIDVRGEEI